MLLILILILIHNHFYDNFLFNLLHKKNKIIKNFGVSNFSNFYFIFSINPIDYKHQKIPNA